MNERPGRRRPVLSSGLIIGIILLLSLAMLIFSGWVIFQRVDFAHISLHSGLVKLLFVGLIFGLVGVLLQRSGDKRR